MSYLERRGGPSCPKLPKPRHHFFGMLSSIGVNGNRIAVGALLKLPAWHLGTSSGSAPVRMFFRVPVTFAEAG